ncbi:glycine cleavage system protein H [Tropheryma whipplei]|uniref:Glycine cleavage system H protein n=2 Tax=Tropheryma whipplei TaxID=2039 RepID=GCSH_TROWT|nr:glycine cleavage system protein GcvH [Tropheryma whipplei]P64215.1 RecName: Full=Glycine cleavage system H protein [Tropheryma whipplei str. Twist]P64216.1 RecName: Full=Glycine cleavage system H protein [Tropheryma whipplei TW08/27]AAO44734.1 glycine cleavage system H protein [Tropheryma whipplei str. Twist]MCO8182949.1 glycine cleavage system protein GcvH [Tropheryma whipplei]MCO8190544.1 glycine cleavage system protein GcvH [Tropheryma whipplei]CAD67318.1 probable glycine cleavage syste
MFDESDLVYSKEHEWVFIDDDIAWVGITKYAVKKLGDIVYIDLPSQDALIVQGECVGEIESTKSVSEIYSPVSGRVIAVNEDVISSPGLLNSDSSVWLFKAECENIPELMDWGQYSEYTKE